jgi:hypothetical protein
MCVLYDWKMSWETRTAHDVIAPLEFVTRREVVRWSIREEGIARLLRLRMVVVRYTAHVVCVLFLLVHNSCIVGLLWS